MTACNCTGLCRIGLGCASKPNTTYCCEQVKYHGTYVATSKKTGLIQVRIGVSPRIIIKVDTGG